MDFATGFPAGGSPDPLKHSARLCLDAAMRRWSTPLTNPSLLDTTRFFPAEMRMIPERVAKEGWLLWMGNSRRMLKLVLRKQAHLEVLGPDWMAGVLHQPRSHFPDRADAAAYVCLLSLIISGELFLAHIPTRSWAHRNNQVGLNRSTLRSAGVRLSLPRWTGGYDGLAGPRGALPMTQVFFRDTDTPPDIEPAFDTEEEELDWFPLEVGSCSMAKSVAMLVLHGRLARFPYRIRVPGVGPMIQFFALHPEKFREHLHYLHCGGRVVRQPLGASPVPR